MAVRRRRAALPRGLPVSKGIGTESNRIGWRWYRLDGGSWSRRIAARITNNTVSTVTPPAIGSSRTPHGVKLDTAATAGTMAIDRVTERTARSTPSIS